jgi:nucleotide-binding universal stress UspA family protein
MLHMPIGHIIVATDLSPEAEHAVRVAAAWSARLRASLSLLHVHPPTPAGATAMTPATFWPALDTSETEAAHARAALEQVAARLVNGPPQRIEVLEHPSAALGICEHAESTNADLVVVGARGHTALDRLFIGSVAEQVVRHCPCPVLVVRGDSDAAVSPSHLLACTDLSPCAEAGLELAAEIARAFAARVSLASVRLESVWRAAADVSDDATLNSAERDLERHLEKIYRQRFAGPVDVTFPIGSSAAETVVEYASQEGIDLIVVATHGRTGLRRLLLGSVAERVVRHALGAVLVAPSSADSFLTTAL